MNKIVDRIYWVNDTDPALNETNLNQMDSELDALDDRVLALVGDCEAQAEEAEAWAVGERGGDPVSSGDPTYQNNSKYYAQQASGSATTAGNSATAAGNSALAASGSATTAGNQALVSEGFANGTQNGTPVTSGSPYYENNSKYWKEQAQAIASQSLAGLTDVDINAPADGDILIYDSADSEWKNTPTSAATVTNNPISITTQSAQVARDTKITLSPIQASGTQTLANPLPISGYDSVDLADCGKNLFNINAPQDTTYGNGVVSGDRITITGEYRIALDLKLPAGTYTITWNVVSATSREGIRFGYTDGTTSSDFTSSPFTIDTSGKRVEKIYLYVGTLGSGTTETTIYENIQIELGSATAYEAYTSPINFSLPLPETIYGGEHDVEKGILRATKDAIDMGDLNWAYDATYDFFYVPVSTITNYKNIIGAEIQCSAFPFGGFNLSDSTMGTADDNTVYTHYRYVYVKCTQFGSDRVAFKTAVTGQKLVYDLANPIEIQLTPYEVELLQGANVITSNGTSVTLTYREGTIATLEDIPSETVNKLADMVADVQGDISTLDSTKTDLSAIAPIEDGTTASQAYKVNEYFIRGGKLCKCISAISAGSAFTLNTNYKETTLANEIPKYTVSTTDITPGVTPLPAGQFYIVLL